MSLQELRHSSLLLTGLEQRSATGLLNQNSFLSKPRHTPQAKPFIQQELRHQNLHRELQVRSGTPRNNPAALHKSRVQGARRKVNQRTAEPDAANPSFIFLPPSHLFPNPVFLLVSPFSNSLRTGGCDGTKQVQLRIGMHQQVYGPETAGYTLLFFTLPLSQPFSTYFHTAQPGKHWAAAGLLQQVGNLEDERWEVRDER